MTGRPRVSETGNYMGGPGGPPIGPPCNEIGMGGPGVTMGGPWGGLKKKHGGAWGAFKKTVSVEKDGTLHVIHTTPEHPNIRYTSK